DGSITLINTINNAVLDRDGVKAKFDVYPKQMVDFLALIGDSSDNIPGIDKVGPKTGAKLLQQYGGLDELIAHVAEVPGKVGENLRAGLATLELSRRLATIRTDLELPLSPEELTPGAPDVARLRELYTQYELRGLLRQLEGGDAAEGDDDIVQSPRAQRAAVGVGALAAASAAPSAAATPSAARPAPTDIARRYETITRWEDFERWLAALGAAELFAFDTETTSLDYMRAEIVGVSFCIEPGVAAYVPLAHAYPGVPRNMRPRMPTSRCACTARCGRSSRACRRSRGCTGNASSRSCRCSSPWSITACSSIASGCARRAASSRASSRSCCSRRTARRVTNSTSSRRGSCNRFFSSGCSCRFAARPRPVSPRPPKTCWRSSPGATRCPGSCSSTAR